MVASGGEGGSLAVGGVGEAGWDGEGNGDAGVDGVGEGGEGGEGGGRLC